MKDPPVAAYATSSPFLNPCPLRVTVDFEVEIPVGRTLSFLELNPSHH